MLALGFLFLFSLVAAESYSVEFVEGYTGYLSHETTIPNTFQLREYTFYHFFDHSNVSQNPHKIILILDKTPFVMNADAITVMTDYAEEYPRIDRMATRTTHSFDEPMEVKIEFDSFGKLDMSKTVFTLTQKLSKEPTYQATDDSGANESETPVDDATPDNYNIVTDHFTCFYFMFSKSILPKTKCGKAQVEKSIPVDEILPEHLAMLDTILPILSQFYSKELIYIHKGPTVNLPPPPIVIDIPQSSPSVAMVGNAPSKLHTLWDKSIQDKKDFARGLREKIDTDTQEATQQDNAEPEETPPESENEIVVETKSPATALPIAPSTKSQDSSAPLAPATPESAQEPPHVLFQPILFLQAAIQAFFAIFGLHFF